MSEQPLRCPEEACTGWVSEIDNGDEHFWGCGECGTTWDERDELDGRIRDAIEKYPYREQCWEPLEWDGDIMEYVELVEEEAGDAREGERRG